MGRLVHQLCTVARIPTKWASIQKHIDRIVGDQALDLRIERLPLVVIKRSIGLCEQGS